MSLAEIDPASSPSVVTVREPHPLTFGIFPGMTGAELGATPMESTTYRPDDTEEALTRLQPPGRPLVIRGYGVYKGGGRVENRSPPDVERYLQGRRILDYVLCYRSHDGDIEDWTRFIRRAVCQVGERPASLQITEEPNNPHAETGGDGSSPNVLQALVNGVLAARDEAARLSLPIQVGFNACPAFDPDQHFWCELARIGGPEFTRAVDYVGFDFFPDVFRPVRFDQLPSAVEGVLTHFRTVSLAAGGIPGSIPIRITENGWPTGPDRPPERQVAVLEMIVRTVHELREALNITHYEFFSLRDAPWEISGFREFGLLRDDYAPKPAFETYRRLIAELGV
jgi:hypothetical protein